MVLSHPNLDHFSGLPSIIDNVETGPVIINEYFVRHSPPGSPSAHLLDLLHQRNHPVETSTAGHARWTIGGVQFEELYPPTGLEESVQTNDTSTVLRIRYRGRSILLTGDIENRGQRDLMRRSDIRADVLLLPHHGSVRGSSRALLDAVAPVVAVRSGKKSAGDAHAALLRVTGATPLLDTAGEGAIQVTIDGDGLHVTTNRGFALQPCQPKS